MKISAVIFDLNGTILEDEDEYGRAFNSVLKSLGVDSKTEFPQTKGIGVKENWPLLIKKYNLKTTKPIELLAKETQDAYLKEMSSVTVRPGFIEFIESLKDSGAKVALATSNTWEMTESILAKVGVRELFDVVTTSEEVVFTKPAPDLFTITADKLEVEREDCLVIEDSASGVVAAHEAWMKVIVIEDENDNEDPSDADFVVNSFSEITPKVVEEL